VRRTCVVAAWSSSALGLPSREVREYVADVGGPDYDPATARYDLGAAMPISDRYELRRPIGRGGMGELWEGIDTRLRRRIAVKRIRRDRLAADAVRRFQREARVMALLRHPGVPVVYDFGEDHDGLFIVMEYVEGWTLAHVLDAHRTLPVPWVATIGAQLCAVLAAAHPQGLIHRDLKPGNLMLCPDGALVVLDFGVATVLHSSDYSTITGSLERPGTPHYMAPEFVTEGRNDARSDLYGVGCLLYEMLTGERVFQADTFLDEIAGHVDRAPVRPASIDPTIPSDLDDLVVALLEKQPDKRPQHAEDVFHRLLPFARDVPGLPGVIEPRLTPNNLYAIAVARRGG
jgi:serine/threonine protein kinase